jgi:hypothetical protein
MTTCEHDSGSMTGCQPLCSDQAVWLVTYHNGSLRDMTSAVCARHLNVTKARVYPSLDNIQYIGPLPVERI